MNIFPAIDLFDGKAVRLFKGDYAQMTVYNENPLAVAKDFEKAGATCLHLVDLEGAKTGETPNLDVISSIVENTNLFTEVGGGIRNMETVRRYLDAGVDRVILGTAAVKDPAFLKEALSTYGEKVAVGIDLRDGKIAIKGWTETAEVDTEDFLLSLQNMGLTTVICTDIAKDGAMQGANHALYKTLSEKFSLKIVASGGVSSLDDVKRLAAMDLYGAIIGKAYYTGAIDLAEAIEVTKQ